LILEIPRVKEEKIKVAEEAPSYRSKPNQPASGIQKPESKISALDNIRNKYKSNGNSSADQNNEPLNLETLQQSWKNYIQKLKEKKNPAFQSFELAQLQVKDENCFEVITSNNIEQKFIEQERNHLFSFLQKQLKNRLLQFSVTIRENVQQTQPIEAPLSSRDQFLKMTEQYPLVKELKDKLRLELDY